MTDPFTVITGTFGILGTVGGIASTVTTVRVSGMRRHVERAQGASSLLDGLRSLPNGHAVGTRLMTPSDEDELRSELSRIVRENAASYAKQNPTPVGLDFARVLMPAYTVLFVAVAIGAFIAAGHEHTTQDAASQQITAGSFLVVALIFLGMTGLLHERMRRRNDARRVAGTPGREYYFGPLVELWQTIGGAVRGQSARRRTARADRER
ncbi:hypothetical protein [Curtobacterium sp. MCBA15_004]|uniref:hypothetical protein n=1 Tax=Curtobacterium sp. MCBA15_004 TaxID=1898733 RepID=UPI001114A9F2|nr:hypothetical protein [Curtobacterium sp. MCBA15_004]WIA97019.1 hypothetical protein QOL16_01120 [Curtobacterium sp. MCBA15_004]